MTDDFDQRAKDLQQRVERLQTSARKKTVVPDTGGSFAEAAAKAEDAIDTAKAFNQNVTWLRRSWDKIVYIGSKVGAVAGVFWEHSGPIRKIAWPALQWFCNKYKALFMWAVYDTRHKIEVPVFNKYKATVVIVITAALPFAVWYGAKPVYITVQQAFMAAVAEKTAYTYFHGSETIEEGKLYSVKTTRKVPSTPDSTTHMHVQQDLIYWLFYPEDIANAVPNEVAWGRITYTGWRWKILGWFPEVKDVEAIPLSELPGDHPAKSGSYYIAHEQLKEAERDGVILPGTDLGKVLVRE